MTAMESVSQSGDPVMENALMDVLIAMGIVTLNPPLTSIFGNVETNASVSPNLVTESAQMKEPCAETTCASAVRMILTAMGPGAITTEIVTAPAFQTEDLVTGPVSQDTTSATTPAATPSQIAPSTHTAMICVHQQATFQNTSNTAAPVISVSPPEPSVRLMRAAAVQWSPRVSSPSSSLRPSPRLLLWSHQNQTVGGEDLSSSH